MKYIRIWIVSISSMNPLTKPMLGDSWLGLIRQHAKPPLACSATAMQLLTSALRRSPILLSLLPNYRNHLHLELEPGADFRDCDICSRNPLAETTLALAQIYCRVRFPIYRSHPHWDKNPGTILTEVFVISVLPEIRNDSPLTYPYLRQLSRTK